MYDPETPLTVRGRGSCPACRGLAARPSLRSDSPEPLAHTCEVQTPAGQWVSPAEWKRQERAGQHDTTPEGRQRTLRRLGAL